jgi:hypothetical protein
MTFGFESRCVFRTSLLIPPNPVVHRYIAKLHERPRRRAMLSRFPLRDDWLLYADEGGELLLVQAKRPQSQRLNASRNFRVAELVPNFSLDNHIGHQYTQSTMLNLDSKVIKFRRRFRGRAPYYGFYSEVARECGTWPSHIRRVYLGASTSRRVAEAIVSEIKRWESARREKRAA